MILPTTKWAILIARQRRAIQGRNGFYKSGIKDKEKWLGLTLPYIDIRFIKYLQWGIPQAEGE